MEASARSNNLLALGQKIVESLGEDGSRDTLACWMAHHIAELISRAEAATGDAKQTAEKECFLAILALWQHRSELPTGMRPFEDIEPVMRAVASLDPENTTPRYYSNARPPKGETPEKNQQEEWLRIVDGLEYSARVLIGYSLAEAAANTLDKSKEWVKLAEAAGSDPGVPEIIVRYIAKTADLHKGPDLHKAERDFLADRASRLRGLISIADQFASALEDRLKALPAVKESDEADEERIVISSRPTLERR